MEKRHLNRKMLNTSVPRIPSFLQNGVGKGKMERSLLSQASCPKESMFSGMGHKLSQGKGACTDCKAKPKEAVGTSPPEKLAGTLLALL